MYSDSDSNLRVSMTDSVLWKKNFFAQLDKKVFPLSVNDEQNHGFRKIMFCFALDLTLSWIKNLKIHTIAQIGQETQLEIWKK